MEKVVTLKQLVGKLSEGNPCFDALFNGFFCHHGIDGDHLSYVADEIQKIKFTEPFSIVYDKGWILF